MAEVNVSSENINDYFIEELLQSWGISQTIQTFKDKAIDVDVFLQINENDVKEILKDFALGIQLKFWKKYADWKENNVELQKMLSNSFKEETLIVDNDINSSEIEGQNRCNTNESAQMNQSESSNSSKESISGDSNNNDDIELSDSETFDAKCSNKVERKKRQNNVKADDPTFVKKKKVVNPNMLAEKRITTFSASNELMNLDLKELLEQSLEGKAVLQSYEINECLEEDDRTALVDIIVKWLLFRITQPKKPELTILKDKILTLFTNEENVYYIAPKEEGENQCLARGKLFDRTIIEINNN